MNALRIAPHCMQHVFYRSHIHYNIINDTSDKIFEMLLT